MTEFHTLTKMDIAALRQCDQLIVRRDPDALVYATKKIAKQVNNPFASDEAVYTIAAPVRFAESWRRDTTHARAFELLYNYTNQVTPFGCILATLKVGDAIEFVFCADAHSSQAMREAGWHADALQLMVRRAGKLVAQWDLSVSVMRDGPSRMVKGTVETVAA